MNNNFYDILINDKPIATVGPSGLKQLHISFGVTHGKPMVKAGGVSDIDDGLTYINWLEEEVDFNCSLQVVPSKQGFASSPMITKKLGQEVEDADENSLCDFCNRTEQETGQLINLGSSPLICAECVNRCADVLKAE